MKKAVIYARVSSKEQEEGYSIPAQLNLLREYARSKGLSIVAEFVNAESAKEAGRKKFGEMVRFFQKHQDSRTVVVEKTDRLYRNLKDCVTLEELGVELHLVKEGRVIAKDSKSQDKLVHGLFVVLAKNYSDNLREEVRKGMREKARQGIYPTRAPFGYRNNTAEGTIEIHPQNSIIVKRIFELYAQEDYSLKRVREIIRYETGRILATSKIHSILRDPFYSGYYYWQDEKCKGKHPLFLDPVIYSKVQARFENQSRSKQRKHKFPFAGLAKCGLCGCAITAEIKKEKYIYYHCTQFHGKCELRPLRQEELSALFAEVLRGIHIPETVLRSIVDGLSEYRDEAARLKEEREQQLHRRIAEVRRRMRDAYTDKVDGKITEEFWSTQHSLWLEEERGLLLAKEQLKEVTIGEGLLTAQRILELANKVCYLYVRASAEEQGKLLKMVLSNCIIGPESLTPTYRKPFDLIFERAKTQAWSTLQDDFRTLLASGVDPELATVLGQPHPSLP